MSDNVGIPHILYFIFGLCLIFNMKKKQPKHALRRTTRNAIIAAVFFLLLPVLVVLDRRFGDVLRQSIHRVTYAEGDWQTYHDQTFTVAKVIDGDTLDVNCPDGKFPTTRVRLLGVDTPETHHPTVGLMYYGPEATEFAPPKKHSVKPLRSNWTQSATSATATGVF